MSSLVLRPATADDAADCGRICHEAFAAIAAQHRFAPDFPSREFAETVLSGMLAHRQVRGTVAERDGAVIGGCFVTDTGPIAAIGPIAVAPQAQNGGVGRQLMEQALDQATRRGAVGARLVQAAYHGRSLALYARLGFEVREPLACMAGALPRASAAGVSVRAAGADEAERCNVLHFRVHGYTREAELADAVRQGSALVVRRGGLITGYATMIGFPGHAVAETNGDLQALIAAAPEIVGPGMLVPTRNGELFRWCLTQGLRVTQPMTLMTLGLYNEPRGAFLPSILC